VPTAGGCMMLIVGETATEAARDQGASEESEAWSVRAA
jgi:hypothetical protein